MSCRVDSSWKHTDTKQRSHHSPRAVFLVFAIFPPDGPFVFSDERHELTIRFVLTNLENTYSRVILLNVVAMATRVRLSLVIFNS